MTPTAAARLLIEGARPVEADARPGPLRAALAEVARAPDTDPDALWELGLWHGVLPLLARRLAAGPPDVREAAPGELVGRLGQWRRDIALRNLQQIALLGRLSGALGDEGIRAVVLKGPVLASTVYPDPGLREFADLDLLVSEEDRDRAVRLLRARGFSAPGDGGPDPADPPPGSYALQLYRERDGGAVDLHWDLAPAHRPLAPDTAGIRARARRLEVHGHALRVPRPEDHLLLLAVHGAKHGPRPWPKLKWIADVAWLLTRTSRADWAESLERARASGSGRAVLLGVALARDLLGAPVPASLGGALRADPDAGALAREVKSRLFLPPDAAEPLARRFRFDWRVLERARDRWAYLGRRLFVPTSRDRRHGPGAKLPDVLLFPYRWLRLLATYLRRPSRLKRHWS